MKKLSIICMLLGCIINGNAQVQTVAGNGYWNINGFKVGFVNGSDTLFRAITTGLEMKKPILLNVWTTAGRPGSPSAGMFGFNSDSLKIEWYAGGWQQPGAGGGGGTTYTFSTGLTNSAGTVTANLSTGVSGGQTLIGSTSTNSGIIYKTTTGVGATGADHIWVGGNNGATEFMRILNNGNVGIGVNNPATKLAVEGGNSRFDCYDGSDVFGNITTGSSSNSLSITFNRTLSSGADRINFNGGNYIYNHPGDGEVRIFTNTGGNFLTLYGNGSERIRLPTSGGVTFNTSTNSYTFPTTRATAGQVLTDVAGDGVLSWEASGGGSTLYSGNGTLSGNRTVTGSNNDLTFATTDYFTVNSNYNVWAKNDASRTYTSAIGLSAANYWQFGYTQGAAVFTRGNGIVIDTLNNVGLGDLTQTTMPLYTTGNSTYIAAGLQSKQGNFYAVTTVTGNTTLGVTNNFVLVDATSGNVTITLPAASASFGSQMGLDLIFKRIDNSGNSVTVQRAGSDLIDGANSFTLTTQWEAKKLRALSTSTWGVY